MTEVEIAAIALMQLLRRRAIDLALDPTSITHPAPNAVAGRAADGRLLRFDLSTYPADGISR